MALTLRTNGSGGGLVSAAWWNDYYNLMTGVMTDQPVTFGNTLTLNGTSGEINTSGKWGKTVAGDVIDASGAGTYLKAGGASINFQSPNGTTFMQFVPGAIECQSWLGIRTISGTKLAEFRGNGDFYISGSHLTTTGGSINTATGGTFDSFDVGEIFQCDKNYPKGTVVCPGPSDMVVQCTHDNCHAAMIISPNPGLGLGNADEEKFHNYVALAGRVNALTSAPVQVKQLVVSDGKGGVRPVNYGEPAFVLGFALNNSSGGQVGIFLRSIFVILKQAE